MVGLPPYRAFEPEQAQRLGCLLQEGLVLGLGRILRAGGQRKATRGASASGLEPRLQARLGERGGHGQWRARGRRPGARPWISARPMRDVVALAWQADELVARRKIAEADGTLVVLLPPSARAPPREKVGRTEVSCNKRD